MFPLIQTPSLVCNQPMNFSIVSLNISSKGINQKMLGIMMRIHKVEEDMVILKSCKVEEIGF
jgi:hypothetical protein